MQAKLRASRIGRLLFQAKHFACVTIRAGAAKTRIAVSFTCVACRTQPHRRCVGVSARQSSTKVLPTEDAPAGVFGRFLLGKRSLRPFCTTHQPSRLCSWRWVTHTCVRVARKARHTGVFGRFLFRKRSLRPFCTTHQPSRLCSWRWVTHTCVRVPRKARHTAFFIQSAWASISFTHTWVRHIAPMCKGNFSGHLLRVYFPTCFCNDGFAGGCFAGGRAGPGGH